MDALIFKSFVISVSLIFSGVLIYHLIHKLKGRQYVEVAKVSKLLIYPVKSLNGVEVDSLNINKVCCYGKYKDRQFILIDSENNMITLKDETILVKIKLSLHNDNEIWFDAYNYPTLKIAIQDEIENKNQVKCFEVFEQTIKGIDCGTEASDWFSKFLSKQNIRLVQHLSEYDMRPSRTRGALPLSTEKKFPIVYQNRASIYLMNESSISDLNRRLDPTKQVTFAIFRPNIVVKNCPEYEEDNWQYVLINETHLRFMNYCGRCVKITIDYETAQMGTEPLKTLRSYRMASDEHKKAQFGYSPMFGIYLGPENNGSINLNDIVFAHKKLNSY